VTGLLASTKADSNQCNATYVLVVLLTLEYTKRLINWLILP